MSGREWVITVRLPAAVKPLVQRALGREREETDDQELSLNRFCERALRMRMTAFGADLDAEWERYNRQREEARREAIAEAAAWNARWRAGTRVYVLDEHGKRRVTLGGPVMDALTVGRAVVPAGACQAVVPLARWKRKFPIRYLEPIEESDT